MNEFFNYKEWIVGGTELMVRLLHEEVAPFIPKLEHYNFIVLPGRINLFSYQQLLEDPREIILWIHNHPSAFLPPVDRTFFQSNLFQSKVKLIVTVSNFARKVFIEESGIEPNKVIVIHNVVKFVDPDFSKFSASHVPKLIYSSDSDRGLELALKVLHRSKEEFIFDVYSNFNEDFSKRIGSEVMSDSRFIFHGRQSHEELLDALSKSHLFVYPSVVSETFCLALGEALAAGCLCVYPNIGALKEIGMGHGLTYSLEQHTDFTRHEEQLSETLAEAFHLMKSNGHLFYKQREDVLAAFSIDRFKSEWFKVFFQLMES